MLLIVLPILYPPLSHADRGGLVMKSNKKKNNFKINVQKPINLPDKSSPPPTAGG